MSLDDRNNLVASRLNHLNDELIKAKTERIQKESLYNQLKSQASGAPADSIPAVAQNPQVLAIKGKLNDLLAQRTRLSEKYDFKHPQMQQVNGQISEAQQQLQAEAAKTLQSIRSEYETSALTEGTL